MLRPLRALSVAVCLGVVGLVPAAAAQVEQPPALAATGLDGAPTVRAATTALRAAQTAARQQRAHAAVAASVDLDPIATHAARRRIAAAQRRVGAARVSLRQARVASALDGAWADRGPGWEQRRGEAVLASLDFDWQALGVPLTFLPARSGYYGLTFLDGPIEIYVRPDQSPAHLSHVVAHELGHAIDLRWLDDADRARYRELRALDDRGWYACGYCTDFDTPAGDFAEVFATALVGARHFSSNLAAAPDPGELRQLRRLVGQGW